MTVRLNLKLGRFLRAALKRGVGFSLHPSDLTVKKLDRFRQPVWASSAFDNKNLN